MANWYQRLLTRLGSPAGASVSADIATMDTVVDAIKTITDALPNAGALSDLATILTAIQNGTYGLSALEALVDDLETRLSAIRAGYLDELAAANLPTDVAALNTLLSDGTYGLAALEALVDDLETRLSAVRAGYLDNLSGGAVALAASWTAALATALAAYTAARGGYLDELAAANLPTDVSDVKTVADGIQTDLDNVTDGLGALKTLIDSIAGVNSYQELIPDTDFALAAIDVALTTDPPGADAENSVVDIDANAGDTFVLRSLFVSITSFGTGALLTFKLWVPVNGTITKVDEVDVTSLGIQNLMDIFGLQEIYADSIHITVQCDVGNTGACSGTWKYAKAS